MNKMNGDCLSVIYLYTTFQTRVSSLEHHQYSSWINGLSWFEDDYKFRLNSYLKINLIIKVYFYNWLLNQMMNNVQSLARDSLQCAICKFIKFESDFIPIR